MAFKHKNITQGYFFLFASILFSLLGAAVLFFGALAHINPNVHFSALFSKEPMMNLIYSIIPAIR